jgi:multiple sugar transport system permease protein
MICKKYSFFDEIKKSVLLFPAVIVMFCFFIIPIVLTVYYSFTNLALSGSNARNLQFVGLQNYKRMLTDPTTITCIKNTFVFLIGSLVGQTVIGFLIAYFMRKKSQAFRSVAGPCFLAGWVMPEIVVALCFMAFFKENGTLNVILGVFGIRNISWLYEHPMLSVIVANVWHGAAFSMLNFQSALDNVSGDIEEAARVDGASRLQVLIWVILPCIKDTLATNTMLNTLSTLGVYGLIYSMTGGGPANKTTTLPIYMYNQGLKGMQLGFGTAIGMMILLVGVVCSLVYTLILRDKDR